MNDPSGELEARSFLRFPLSPRQLALEGVALFGLLFVGWTLYRYWPELPERVPQHFNLRGEPDAWGGRAVLLILPMMCTFLWLLLTLARWCPPWMINLPFTVTPANAETQCRYCFSLLIIIKVEILWLFALLTWLAVQVAIGARAGLGKVFLPLFLGILFGILAVYLWLAWRAR